jgi:hypothetical protein
VHQNLNEFRKLELQITRIETGRVAELLQVLKASNDASLNPLKNFTGLILAIIEVIPEYITTA